MALQRPFESSRSKRLVLVRENGRMMSYVVYIVRNGVVLLRRAS